MSSIFGEAARQEKLPWRRLGLLVAASLLLLCFAPQASAQNTFSSGSTGIDGAFEPTSSQTVVVPDSGVLNYTTVNIPAAVTVTFVRNSKNRPLTILASSNVTIAGTIMLDGRPANATGGFGTGGPGGFDGGSGGYPFDVSFAGATGDGPGGGGGGAGSPTVSSPPAAATPAAATTGAP
ncbi:MAG: hypothetical protein ABW208_26230 [Pyrinomonadaceae bacterium]